MVLWLCEKKVRFNLKFSHFFEENTGKDTLKETN